MLKYLNSVTKLKLETQCTLIESIHYCTSSLINYSENDSLLSTMTEDIYPLFQYPSLKYIYIYVTPSTFSPYLDPSLWSFDT